MGFFISSQFGSYYEGDRVHPNDIAVPQRPSPFYNFVAGAWVLDQARLDAFNAEQVRRQALIDAQVDPLIQQLRNANPTQITNFITTNVTDLASARQVMIKLAIAIAFILRNNGQL